MFQVRTSQERGHANHGWLDSYHTFSFANYYDPEFMGFRSLRVINEDRIDGGQGFGMHPHRDMEIITYMIDGALEHQDSMGHREVIRPGEVQRMTAGTGVRHSEYNADAKNPAHLLQIWILPKHEGAKPGYEQKQFAEALSQKGLVLAVSESGRDGSMSIDQDVDLYLGRLAQGHERKIRLAENRYAWLQMVKGEIQVGERTLRAGDALVTAAEREIVLNARTDADFVLFDLA